jgi:murein DD-endopeptidase MepM/ murein hydrolase activator NlpD
MGLAHYYRKSKIKLNHVWLSDSAQLSLINSSAKNAENLFTLIKLHMAQLKNNKDALLSYHKEFKKRQTRLEKLHMNLASALNLKKSEYDHFRNLVAQQIHELKTDFEQHGLNIISSKASTLYSPIFGSVVFTHYDQILGNVIIIEKSTHTHLIFFDLQHSNLKKGDRLKPGDIIAVNSTKIPKLQIRILNQTIPIYQVIAKGS